MKMVYILLNIILCYEHISYFYKKNSTDDPGFYMACSLVGTFLHNLLLAMLLTLLQIYSFELLTICMAALIGIILGYLYNRKSLSRIQTLLHWILKHKYHIIPTLLLLVAAILYMLFPTKYMLGGRDPGLYLLNGIHISRTGTIQYESDEYINEHYEEVRDVLFPGYPGLFTPEALEGMEGNPGDISPQFLPMLPSILAVGHDLAGIEGLIRVNCIIGILSLMVLYYVAKRLFSQNIAIALLLIMIFEPAQLWGARLTETEILSQLLFFLSMYCFTVGWRENKNSVFAAAGFFLGIGCMNRIDTYIYGAGLIVGLIYCILWKRKNGRGMCLAFGIYFILGIFSLLYGWKYSHIYIVEHWNAGVLSGVVWLNVMGLFLSLLVSAVCHVTRHTLPNYVMLLIKNKKALLSAFAVLLGIFLYAYFIRPYGNDSFDRHAMVEFCWYTSVPMVLFSLYGMYRIFWDKQEHSEEYFVFFLVSLASVFVYTIAPNVASDHIWAGRRWIAVNIPFVLLLGCYGIEKFPFGGNVVKGVAVVCVAGFMAYQSKPFIFSIVMEGLDKQYAELAADLDPDEIYFTTEPQIASYLKYIYDKPVYLISEEKTDAYVKFLEEQGSINYIGSERIFGSARYYYQYNSEPRKHELNGMYLEKTVGAFPKKLYERKIPATIYELTYGAHSVITLGEDDIPTDHAWYDEMGNICADGVEGIIFYGPYITLDAGQYEVSLDFLDGKLPNKRAVLEISYNMGKEKIATREIDSTGTIVLPFDLKKSVPGIEIRLFAEAENEIICNNIRIRKLENHKGESS